MSGSVKRQTAQYLQGLKSAFLTVSAGAALVAAATLTVGLFVLSLIIWLLSQIGQAMGTATAKATFTLLVTTAAIAEKLKTTLGKLGLPLGRSKNFMD